MPIIDEKAAAEKLKKEQLDRQIEAIKLEYEEKQKAKKVKKKSKDDKDKKADDDDGKAEKERDEKVSAVGVSSPIKNIIAEYGMCVDQSRRGGLEAKHRKQRRAAGVFLA